MSANRTSSLLPPPPEEESAPEPAPSRSAASVGSAATLALEKGKQLVRARLDARATYEDRLIRDILLAERFRARFLLALPTIALFLLVVQGNSDPEAVAA